MRAGAVLAVAGLLALAGCGLAGSPEPAPSVTPAAVPGDPTEEGAVRERPTLAPGVTSGGVDPVALSRAHHGTLRTRNFSIRLVRSVEAMDGTVLARTESETRAALAARRYHLRRVREGAPESPLRTGRSETSYWRAGSLGIVRRSTGANGTAVYALARSDRFRRALDDPTRAERIGATIAAFGRFTVTDVPGSPVTLVGTGLSRPDLLTPARGLVAPRAAWLRVTVSETGVVRTYALRYRAAVAGTNRTVTVEERLTVGDVEGPVDPPPWLPAARNATGVPVRGGGE